MSEAKAMNSFIFKKYCSKKPKEVCYDVSEHRTITYRHLNLQDYCTLCMVANGISHDNDIPCFFAISDASIELS